MIIKGNRHNNGGKLASYMMSGDARKGERAELHQIMGFGEAGNIAEAFRDLEIMAEATKADNALFHVQIRLPEHERLTPEQWERAADRTEKRLGLTGQPRAITFHIDKTGDRHMHVGWSLIDADEMKAKPLPFFKFRLKALARELENEFDITRVKNERDGPILYAATKNEQQQAQRLGVDKDPIRNAIRACWERSDCGRSFDDALANEGLILAQGTRRDFVVMDHAGGLHALGKRILDVSAGQVRARLADLDRDQIPTIEQAREFMLDLPRDRVDKLTRELADVQAQIKAEQEYARRDPVRDEIQWQDALDKAAIAKEKAERQFVEPHERDKEETRAGRGQRQPGNREERVWPIHPPQHQSWPGFEKASSEATRDERTENLKGVAAKVWELWSEFEREKHAQAIDAAITFDGRPFSIPTDIKAFATGLDDKGIMFAVANKDESERSHREAEFARAVGNYAPRFKEGEIVIVTEQRPEYRREGAIIEPPRIHRFDQSLADKFVLGLGGRDKLQGIDGTLLLSDNRAQQRRAEREAAALERASDIRDFSRIIPANAKDGIRASFKVASSALGGIGKGVDAIADGFASLFAPVLTPQQKREAEITQQGREAEADATLDYSRYTADATQQRRQQENDREAERQRQRDGNGRER